MINLFGKTYSRTQLATALKTVQEHHYVVPEASDALSSATTVDRLRSGGDVYVRHDSMMAGESIKAGDLMALHHLVTSNPDALSGAQRGINSTLTLLDMKGVRFERADYTVNGKTHTTPITREMAVLTAARKEDLYIYAQGRYVVRDRAGNIASSDKPTPVAGKHVARFGYDLYDALTR